MTNNTEALKRVKLEGDAIALRVVSGNGELKDLFFVRDKNHGANLDIWVEVDDFQEFKRIVGNG